MKDEVAVTRRADIDAWMEDVWLRWALRSMPPKLWTRPRDARKDGMEAPYSPRQRGDWRPEERRSLAASSRRSTMKTLVLTVQMQTGSESKLSYFTGSNADGKASLTGSARFCAEQNPARWAAAGSTVAHMYSSRAI